MARDANAAPKPGSADPSEKAPKSHQPENTAFRQQRLKAWQPILTPRTVIPLFFIIGLIFTPIGGLLYYANDKVQEISIDYTDCAKHAPLAPAWKDIPSSRVSQHFKQSGYGLGTPPAWQHHQTQIKYDGKPLDTTICSVQFDILNDLRPPVLLYYRLTNFFQNHRRYVKSLDAAQLKGDAKSASSLSSDCNPVRVQDGTNKPFYPCGLIANSFFNDTFTSPVLMNTQNSSLASQTYLMSNKGIAWKSDGHLYGKTKYQPDEVVPPPNWHDRYPNGYTNSTGLPDLHEDEALQVWMRTAGLPSFSKLARRNETAVMSPGRYLVDIRDYFPVTEYGGTKSILITTRTIVGGRNIFLSIAYLVVGGLCTLLGLVFTILNCVRPRRLGDHNNLKLDSNPAGPAGLSVPGTSSGVSTHGGASVTNRGFKGP